MASRMRVTGKLYLIKENKSDGYDNTFTMLTAFKVAKDVTK